MPVSHRDDEMPESVGALWRMLTWEQRWKLLATAGWFAVWPPRLVRLAIGLSKIPELGVGQKQRLPIAPWAFDGVPLRVYLWGESSVEVESFADIHDWLAECHYASDWDVFGRVEHWAHPSQFEELRMGDCEDHAIWAWRKLIELSVPCWLMIGRHGGHEGVGHAWIRFAHRGKIWVYESVDKEGEWGELMSLREAYERGYRPYVSIDGDLKTYVHQEMFEPLYEGRPVEWIDEVGHQCLNVEIAGGDRSLFAELRRPA